MEAFCFTEFGLQFCYCQLATFQLHPLRTIPAERSSVEVEKRFKGSWGSDGPFDPSKVHPRRNRSTIRVYLSDILINSVVDEMNIEPLYL